MAKEKKYDEDLVNLGYLNKTIEEAEEKTDKKYADVSKTYASKPQPPYKKGDTWIDGDIVYTCITSRSIGTFVESDWVTESGAKKEAEKKNKTFLTQPSNYSVGDMWILQTDNDHRAGKKGEILITTAGRREYDSDDWVNMLGYGTIRSINEVANNINDALKRLGISKKNGVITIFYKSTIPEEASADDLWYVTEELEGYIKGSLYKYSGEEWLLTENSLVVSAFEEANEARLVEDERILAFYSEEEPTENMAVGDIWTRTTDKKLYRYNGTKWVAVYDTQISEVREEMAKIVEVNTEITTDLGEIKERVTSVETGQSEVNESLAQQSIEMAKITNEVSTTEKKIEELEGSKVGAEEYNTTIKSLQTLIEQGNSDIEFKFKQVNTTTEEIANIVTTNQQTLEEYIRFKGALIELGRVGNDFTAELSNTELAFLQNGTKIAYISNNKLYITDAEVQNKLVIVIFAFIPRDNGNLSFTWIGG